MLILTLLSAFQSIAQRKGDSKIVITVADTVGIIEKIKLALVKADFLVKELNMPDSIVTYPRDLKTMNGVAVAHVKIEDSQVVINGFYTLKHLNYFGFTKMDKDVKPITYFKSGKLWPLLMKVAKEIPGEISFKD